MLNAKFGILVIVLIFTVLYFVGASMATRQIIPQEVSAAKAKQKEHAKLYRAFKSERKLPELAATIATGQEVTVINGLPEKVFSPDAPRFNLQAFLKNLTCNSDALVIGTIKNKSSQLTEGEDFIFTDYEMAVDEVLKDNTVAPIQPASDITITRPGGTIQLNGRIVSALDESLEPLESGQRYLLFLKFVPSTGAYEAFNSQGSFQLCGKKFVKLTKESLPSELEGGNNAASFITEIRHALIMTCDR